MKAMTGARLGFLQCKTFDGGLREFSLETMYLLSLIKMPGRTRMTSTELCSRKGVENFIPRPAIKVITVSP